MAKQDKDSQLLMGLLIGGAVGIGALGLFLATRKGKEPLHRIGETITRIGEILDENGIKEPATLKHFEKKLHSNEHSIEAVVDWKRWAFMPKNLHVWEMFIKPQELKFLLQQNNFIWKENKGASPDISFIKLLGLLRNRAKGNLTYKELGEKFSLSESNDKSIFYMGWAVKR